jgi:putative phosphoesterase
MKVALISDLHGNYQAWEAVRKEIKENHIKTIFCLGDVFGYYFESIKIIEELLDFDVLFVKGNHECLFLDLMHKKVSLENVNFLYRSSYNDLNMSNNDFFVKLVEGFPLFQSIFYNNIKLCLFHATPFDVDTYVYPNSTNELLDKVTDSRHDFYLFGHTHYQFGFCRNNKTIINPGSVGQSKNCGGFAHWAILDLNSLEIIFRSTKYNRRELINSVKRIDPTNIPLLNLLFRNN